MLNPVLQAIADRRSIRGYKPEQITEEQLSAIIDAAQAAPSANNSQPWHFSVVQNAAMIERLNDAFIKEAVKSVPLEVRERIAAPGYSVFYNAPTVIFVSCPPLESMRYAEIDSGIATQNIVLAAHSLGLGSLVLGMPRFAFVGEDADALRRDLRFPDGYDYCLAVAIGMPATTKEAHPILPDRVSYIR